MRILILVILALFMSTFLPAQGIKGIILTSQNEPIIQAYIYSPSEKLHTHSDLLGKFTFQKVNVGDTLIVSFLGFENTQRIIDSIDLNNEIKIYLKEKFFELDQVNITNTTNSISQVSSIDLQTSPVKSSQEILTKIPGLFIAQHAGGGKAEQIFLRGFDIDHGTDISIQVDGMPVNMVSHAHGQGYADLHFVIPETVDKIDFGKGPYQADIGNFATAGHINFKLKDRLDASTLAMEVGAFNTRRILAMLDLIGDEENESLYIAGELQESDGPFESPQNFHRINILGKYTRSLANQSKIGISISHFQSQWDASGQIPQRLVNSGIISRFGAVDDTEGGTTSRTNLNLNHSKPINDHNFIITRFFYSIYDFTLFSNFTFFLENPSLGDQIKQKEERSIYGIESILYNSHDHPGINREIQVGLGFRYDNINENELSNTLQRVDVIQRYALGDVNESNLYGFINAQFRMENWVFNFGSRIDYFDFQYKDALQPTYTVKSKSTTIFSPKANILYNPNRSLQLYLKSGLGFHSNDSRVIIQEETDEILPSAYGLDLGSLWKPFPRLWINSALWYLYMEQEFVYVGDAGIVEPSGKSRRQGIEMGLRYQMTNNLFINTDISYTLARSVEAAENQNYIPLAPDLIATGSIIYKDLKGINGGLSFRFIKDRPANETNSIIAEGYFLLNGNIGFDIGNMTFGIHLENILNTNWNESQFATESRLESESQSFEELHFTPGNPINIRGRIQYRF